MAEPVKLHPLVKPKVCMAFLLEIHSLQHTLENLHSRAHEEEYKKSISSLFVMVEI